jgi:hypothetical protein
MATLTNEWSSEAQHAFEQLKHVEDAYIRARSVNEVDMSGCGCSAFAAQEEGRLRDQFLTILQRFAKGDVPPATHAEFEQLDRELNQAYSEIQHSSPKVWQWGTVNPEGIRTAEIAWIRDRDAWLASARVAYPSLSADTVAAEITGSR